MTVCSRIDKNGLFGEYQQFFLMFIYFRERKNMSSGGTERETERERERERKNPKQAI